jgi:hypothetical protein
VPPELLAAFGFEAEDKSKGPNRYRRSADIRSRQISDRFLKVSQVGQMEEATRAKPSFLDQAWCSICDELLAVATGEPATLTRQSHATYADSEFAR